MPDLIVHLITINGKWVVAGTSSKTVAEDVRKKIIDKISESLERGV